MKFIQQSAQFALATFFSFFSLFATHLQAQVIPTGTGVTHGSSVIFQGPSPALNIGINTATPTAKFQLIGTASFGTNTVTGINAFGSGNGNTVSSSHSHAFGENNNVNAYASFATGQGNTITGQGKASALGWNNTVSGANSQTLGSANNVSGNYAGAFGVGLTASAGGSYIIGGNSGTSLVNNIANSLMIGWGSQATMLVNGSNNYVGIGTTTPESRLHVNGNISMPQAGKLIFGDNTFGTGEWIQNVGSTNGYGIGFYSNGSERMRIKNNGNVGIGTTTPAAMLDVIGETRVTSATDATRTYRITSGSRQEIYATNDLLTFGGQNQGHIINTISAAGAGTFSVYNNNISGTPLFSVLGASGRVGIGTVAPTAKLDVVGDSRLGGRVGVFSNTTSDMIDAVNDAPANTVGSGSSTLWLAYKNTQSTTNPMLIQTSAWDPSISNYRERFVVKNNGQVTIGDGLNTPAGYRLYVDEGILTPKLKVAPKNSANWADYVFAKDYPLSKLVDVEAFVKKNKHLPNMPSAAEVDKNGLDVMTMFRKQMEKIEELTLYVIQMSKDIEQLKAENKVLKAQTRK